MQLATTGPAPGARLRAFRHRNYCIYWTGQLVSLIGTWMQNVAQLWLMHRLTHSAMWLGLLGFTQFLPVMLLSLWAGAIIDRMDKRRLLFVTQGAALVQAAVLAAVVSAGIARPWMVLALAFVFGIINSFDMPARQSFVVELVDGVKEDLGNAIALNSAAFNTARIAGPAVAGVLLATIGEAGCFWLNALSYVAVLFSLTQIALPPRPFWRSGPAIGATLLHGVRYAWDTRPLRHLLLLLGVTAGLGFQYLLLLPVYARDILHAGAPAYGLLVTAFGAGALVGAVRVMGRSGRAALRANLVIGLLACGAGLAVFAWSRVLALSFAAGLLAGFGLIVYVSSTNVLLQLTTEDRYRGRVMSLYTLMFAGTAPLGALGSGAIAQRWGAPVSTSVSAAVMLGGVVIVLWRSAILRGLALITGAAPTAENEPPPVERE
jgi:MFS family permease